MSVPLHATFSEERWFIINQVIGRMTVGNQVQLTGSTIEAADAGAIRQQMKELRIMELIVDAGYRNLIEDDRIESKEGADTRTQVRVKRANVVDQKAKLAWSKLLLDVWKAVQVVNMKEMSAKGDGEDMGKLLEKMGPEEFAQVSGKAKELTDAMRNAISSRMVRKQLREDNAGGVLQPGEYDKLFKKSADDILDG
jgi:hypothetical protein